MIFKRKDPKADPRKNAETLIGGRRAGENENPYLSARRTWKDHTQGVISTRQAWQVMGILSMLVALTGVGGMIHIGQLSKFVPYVIQVDKLGQTAAIARADRASPVDGRVVASVVSAFISNSRIVTIDIALQRKAVMDVYAMLAPGDPSLQKMTEWLNGTEESSPFKRAIKEMVSVEVVNVLAQTPDTWEVDWIETTRDRQGIVTGKPSYMRALVNIKVVEPTPATSEEQIRKNPMGIYVKDFSWSRQQQF